MTTVRELITKLQAVNPDLLVFIGELNYGDNYDSWEIGDVVVAVDLENPSQTDIILSKKLT